MPVIITNTEIEFYIVFIEILFEYLKYELRDLKQLLITINTQTNICKLNIK